MTTDLDEAMRIGARPVRHGVNNHLMVLAGNLDLLARSAPEGSPAARQIARAKEAQERLAALLAAYLTLPRDAGVGVVRPAAALAALMPLLESVVGGGVALDGEAEGAVLWPRPALPVALLAWAFEAQAARSATPVVTPKLRLVSGPKGLSLTPEPQPRQSAPHFAAAAAAMAGQWDGVTLLLPVA